VLFYKNFIAFYWRSVILRLSPFDD